MPPDVGLLARETQPQRQPPLEPGEQLSVQHRLLFQCPLEVVDGFQQRTITATG